MKRTDQRELWRCPLLRSQWVASKREEPLVHSLILPLQPPSSPPPLPTHPPHKAPGHQTHNPHPPSQQFRPVLMPFHAQSIPIPLPTTVVLIPFHLTAVPIPFHTNTSTNKLPVPIPFHPSTMKPHIQSRNLCCETDWGTWLSFTCVYLPTGWVRLRMCC